MNKVVRIITSICFVFVGMVAITIGIFLYVVFYAPLVPEDYIEKVKTGGEIEARYITTGNFTIKYDSDITKAQVGKLLYYYPEELTSNNKTYPLVIMVNGEGTLPNKQKYLFQHLASWGFIVFGNYDINPINGKSIENTLKIIKEYNENKNHIFYKKIDFDNIGITSYSQGVIGVYNFIINKSYSNTVKCAVFLSPKGYDGEDITKYNFSLINFPFMILTGTLKENVPFSDIQTLYYNNTSSTKLLARKKDIKRIQMIYNADGYATAWFMYYLQNNKEAGLFFNGDYPELLNNTLYQDQQISIKN